MNAAYREGLYFDGDIDIPIIDWRPYLEERLDMHNSHQSFASRQRMLDHDGRASNQVIWFSGPDDSRILEAFGVMDEWLLDRRPPEATDRCFTNTGTEIARGSRVWDGILNSRPDGVVHDGVPDPLDLAHRGRRADPRRRLQVRAPVRSARRSRAGSTARGSRARPSGRSSRQIFPTGVCDYTKDDVGRPRHHR